MATDTAGSCKAIMRGQSSSTEQEHGAFKSTCVQRLPSGRVRQQGLQAHRNWGLT